MWIWDGGGKGRGVGVENKWSGRYEIWIKKKFFLKESEEKKFEEVIKRGFKEVQKSD